MKARRRRVIGSVAVTVTVVTAVSIVVWSARRPVAATASSLPPATASVVRQTLTDSSSEDGSLGYGPTTAVLNRLPGTVTGLPEQGRVAARGEVLYRVDNIPVVLLFGTVPAYRGLGVGDKGPDVRELEENLRALGYTGFTVDDTFSAGTATAVKAWQKKLGVTQTGRTELGSAVFTAGPVRVSSVDAALGEPATPGGTVVHVTGTVRVVTVTVDVSEQALVAKDRPAVIVLPNAKMVPATVTAASTVIKPASNPDSAATTEVEAVVTPADPSTMDGLDEASVHVLFTRAERQDVLTVPVAALVVLREGGYGIEVVDGHGSHYVAVQTGLFADGRVEISGDDVTAGLTVGMPA